MYTSLPYPGIRKDTTYTVFAYPNNPGIQQKLFVLPAENLSEIMMEHANQWDHAGTCEPLGTVQYIKASTVSSPSRFRFFHRTFLSDERTLSYAADGSGIVKYFLVDLAGLDRQTGTGSTGSSRLPWCWRRCWALFPASSGKAPTRLPVSLL